MIAVQLIDSSLIYIGPQIYSFHVTEHTQPPPVLTFFSYNIININHDEATYSRGGAGDSNVLQ